MTPRLELFTRPGCHLCDDARAVLDRLAAPYTETDISIDPELERRFLVEIPVVTVDGEVFSVHFVDEDALRARVS